MPSRWPALISVSAAVRPACELIGNDRHQGRRSRRYGVQEHGSREPSTAWERRRLRVYIDASTIPSTWRSIIASSSSCSSLGSPSVSAISRSGRARGQLERALDEVAGERRRGDGVRDEPERVGRAGAQAPRDDVRSVARLAALRADPSSTSAEMRISSRRPVRTKEAAVFETPASRATSARVTRFGVPGRGRRARCRGAVDIAVQMKLYPLLIRFSTPISHACLGTSAPPKRTVHAGSS